MAMKIPDPDDAAVFALDALEPLGDGAVDRDVDAGTEADALAYADAVSSLAEAVASPPVLGLRGHVLAAAFADRAPGTSIDDGGSDPAAVAFARTVADLDALLASLDELDWIEPAHAEIGRVRDVVAHLLAIELYVLEQLLPSTEPSPAAPRPGTADDALGHLEYAQPTVDGAAEVPVDELRHRWRQAADALAAAADIAPADTVVQLHALQVRVEGAMVMRTFELWAHLDDIARATGRRRPRLDARRLRAMSAALTDALPIAVAMSGHGAASGVTRLVLTGPGGGVYDVRLGEPTSDATGHDATVTVDVVDLCRVAARRASEHRVEVRIDGDRALASAVLASTAAFAMD